MRVGAIVLGVLALVVMGVVAPVSAQTSEAEQVLEQFERALNAYDEDGVTRLFASDGSVRDNLARGEVVTSAQLRGWVRRAGERRLHAHLGDYNTTRNGTTQFTIEVGQGEWFRTGEIPRRAHGTAEVRGGRIVLLVLDPAAQAPAAVFTAIGDSPATVALAPLALGAMVALGVSLALARMRQRPPPTSVSSAVGVLHTALGAWNAGRRRTDD